MQSIILVGGEGTRLRPLTYDTPKQLLPLLGVPMLDQVVRHMASHGVTEVILSLGYLPNRFIDRYPDHEVAGVPIRYVVEPAPLDTAGAIRFAASEAGVRETFLVVNGDVLTTFDLTRLVAFHRAQQAVGTIALHSVEDPSRFGVVVTSTSGQVVRFVEKPPRGEAPTNQINAGVYVFEPSIIERIRPGGRVSVERETFPALAAEGQLFALADDAYWLDTGTPATFIQANVDSLRESVTASTLVGTSWIHPLAHVDPSARLSYCVIDVGCSIGADVVLDQVVLMPHVTVEGGVEVHRAIIAPHSTVTSADHIESDAIFDSQRA